MPDVPAGRNCFRCTHLGASVDGYICTKGFQNFRGSHGVRTIWTGDLALHCPLYDARTHVPAVAAPAP